MNILDFVALALAANSITTAWFYGSLFKQLLAYFDKKKKQAEAEGKFSFFGELLTCVLCLPYHISGWTAFLFWLPAQLLPTPWDNLPRLFLFALAVTTLVHYMQGVLPLEDDDGKTNNTDDTDSLGETYDSESTE
jgi:hypothetical protein